MEGGEQGREAELAVPKLVPREPGNLGAGADRPPAASDLGPKGDGAGGPDALNLGNADHEGVQKPDAAAPPGDRRTRPWPTMSTAVANWLSTRTGKVVAGLGLVATVVTIVSGLVATAADTADLLSPQRTIPVAPSASSTTTAALASLAGSATECEQRSQLPGKVLEPSKAVVTLCISARGATEEWMADAGTSPRGIVAVRAAMYNTGGVRLENVVMRAQLPDTLTLVADSTTLYNAAYPTGYAASDELTGVGVNLGHYAPGVNAYLLFYVRAADAAVLQCGPNRDLLEVVAETDFGQSSGTSIITTEKYGC